MYHRIDDCNKDQQSRCYPGIFRDQLGDIFALKIAHHEFVLYKVDSENKIEGHFSSTLCL